MANSSDLVDSAYANADTRNNAQKEALLAAIAQNGAAGKAAFEQANQGVDANRQQAIEAAANGTGPNLLTGQKDLGFLEGGNAPALSTLHDSNVSEANALENDTTRQTNAQNDYYGRLSSAIPIEKARSQSAIEQILQDAKDKEADRAFNTQMQQMQLQEAQANLANARIGPSGSSGNLSVTDALKLQDASLGQAQQKFLADFAATWGPKTVSVFNQLITPFSNGKAPSYQQSMAALDAIRRDSANFTKPIYQRDSNGQIIFDNQHHAKIEFDPSHVNEDVLKSALQAYYSGNNATSRTDYKNTHPGS